MDKTEYYFPTEIPNKTPDKKYLDIVDKTLEVSHFKIALVNLYELIDKRWEGEKGLDKRIKDYKKVVKNRISRVIDLEDLPKVKLSLNI